MIPRNVVEALIEIGKSGDPNEPATVAFLDSISDSDSVNREHWRDWEEVTNLMPTIDLVFLTKGLVIAEHYHRWCGGSVAAAIWTFRQIQRRDLAIAVEVADWILPRTRNPWVPYGRQNHGATSSSEHRSIERQRAECISSGLAAERASQERAETERRIREAQRKRSAHDRHSDIRQQLIVELSNLTIEEQLCRLGKDAQYSIEFYPTRIADAATEEVLKSLDEPTRLALWIKLKGKKRGPWSKFKRRLRSTFESNPWDRPNWFH